MDIWKPLIVCSGPDCGFSDLIVLTQNLITDLIILSTFLATATFAYVGYILLTSSGNPGALTKAKDMAWKVLKGYLWILVAWLLIYTITNALLHEGYSLLGPPK
ncbi:MAG: hypothetical protein ABIF06_00285 [bacterium]